MSEILKKYGEKLSPYRDIIIFVVSMLGANVLWKLTIAGDENGTGVTFLGLDITAPFDFMAVWIAQRSFWWLDLFRDNVYLVSKHIFGFFNGTLTLFDDVRISVVWGCTGIKQSFIWLIIMLFARGSMEGEKWSFWNKHKLWFIPLGWVCIYVFNVFRSVMIALLIENHREMFDFWHTYIFKYAFYAMLFMLWVWWIESIVKKPKEINN